jgi:hypothetical protein
MKRTRMSLAKVINLRQAGKASLGLAALLLLVSVALARPTTTYPGSPWTAGVAPAAVARTR